MAQLKTGELNKKDWWDKWPRWWIGLVCSGALLLALVAFNLLNQILPTSNDVELYYRYAVRMLHGELPYRDFLVEYPPFALPFIVLPGLFCYPLGGLELDRFKILFHTECFILSLATLWLAYALLSRVSTQRLGWKLAAYTLGSLLISIFLFQRFDIAAAFLTMLAVWFFYRGQVGLAGVALGLGAMAKLYPAVMLPIFLLYLWYTKGDRRAVWRYLVGFGLTCTLVILPFALTGLEGLKSFVTYHSERGLQLETIFAGLIVFASYLGLSEAQVVNDHLSFEIVSPWARPLATASTLLTVGGLLLIYFLLWRKIRRDRQLISEGWLIPTLSLSILWFILSNKVLSPQYLIWLLPFVPLWSGRLKTVLFICALPLSFLPFPFLLDWMTRLDWLPFGLLAVRNALLVTLFYWLAQSIFKPKVHS